MIEVGDGEFSYTISDLIKTLAKTYRFKLKIWLTGVELPLEFNDECDFTFLQESVKVVDENLIQYVFYDLIANIRVVIL